MNKMHDVFDDITDSDLEAPSKRFGFGGRSCETSQIVNNFQALPFNKPLFEKKLWLPTLYMYFILDLNSSKTIYMYMYRIYFGRTHGTLI